VDDESIDAIHVALLGLTGSEVIGVFHTLFAGKAGQLVPGNVGAATRALASLAGPVRDVALEIVGADTKTSPVTISAAAGIPIHRECRRTSFRAMHRSTSCSRPVARVCPRVVRRHTIGTLSTSEAVEGVFVEWLDVAL
jgi:hypothetical protein